MFYLLYVYTFFFFIQQNAAVYVHIPAFQTWRFHSQIDDPVIISSPTTDENLLDTEVNGNSSSWNNFMASNETSAPVLDLVTLSPDDEHMKPPLSDLDPQLTLTPNGSPDSSTSQPLASQLIPLTANQLEALNISSQYFSKLSKPINISSKGLFSFSSSLDISSRHLFPHLKNSHITPHKLGHMSSPSSQSGVYVILYRNGRLFPVIHSELSDDVFKQGNWAVVTPIIAVSLGRFSINYILTFSLMYDDASKGLLSCFIVTNQIWFFRKHPLIPGC